MSRIIDLGKVMVSLSGEWKRDASYEYLTVVEHNGSGYISRVDNTGVEPGTDDSVWMRFAKAGESPEITRDKAGNIYVNGELLTSAFADAEAAATRIIETNTAMLAAEQGRVNAENARVTAERQRVEAENFRQQAENGRKSNETARANAENRRNQQEALRQLREDSRFQGEINRSNAEQTRSSQEAQRVLRFRELDAKATAAIEEALAAAKTIDGKLAGGANKVVVGRAIPASSWVPGINYFCSDGLFKFRIKAAIERVPTDTLPNSVMLTKATFLKPIPAGISAYILSHISAISTLKKEDPYDPSVWTLTSDATGRLISITSYQLGLLVNDGDTSANLVIKTNGTPKNLLSYNGVTVKGKYLYNSESFSPYLRVVDSAVVCIKAPVETSDTTAGAYIPVIPKRGVLIRKIKRRKRARNGTTVNTRKVKYMKGKKGKELSLKHAWHIRLQPVCRHWKSVIIRDIDIRRRSIVSG